MNINKTTWIRQREWIGMQISSTVPSAIPDPGTRAEKDHGQQNQKQYGDQ
jgi:hypothetical protein